MPSPTDENERFIRLFLENEQAILRMILIYVPSEPDACDVLQETAIALWKRFLDYDPSRPFVNWACGFARMEVHRFRRRSRTRPLLSERAIAAVMATEGLPTADEDQRERFLAECRSSLPEHQRRILEGYYFEDQTVDTLSQVHGRSVESIYKQLQRIRHVLLDCIERKCAEASP